ncbi:MAG: immunoglobulin domain-containing protein [Patescibacteria group bacterium]|jgi:hypothetical protein
MRCRALLLILVFILAVGLFPIVAEINNFHDADVDRDGIISLAELLRVIQFYNSGAYHACPEVGTEDGFCCGVAGGGEMEMPPMIIRQPDDLTVNEGQAVSLTVVAVGNNLRYQWCRRNHCPLCKIYLPVDNPTAQSPTLSWPQISLEDDDYYFCYVDNDTGSVMTRNAELRVNADTQTRK